jgi:hypothetical protein
MSIDADYLRLVERLGAALPPVEVTGLHRPTLIDGGAYRDEFGFVFLADGSVGRFSVSLEPVPRSRWARQQRPEEARAIRWTSREDCAAEISPFDYPKRLREVLARGESWGRAGRKYRIGPDDCQGVESLIARCER